jgi:dipeptidyl aminopeptidase/acylaminoacyl peptidase
VLVSLIDKSTIFKIKFPILTVWSQDASKIAYSIAGLCSIDIKMCFISNFDSKPVVSGLPSPYPLKERHNIRWSKNDKIIYNSKNNYFIDSLYGVEPEILVSGQLLGNRVLLSPDGRNISFIRDGDLWVKPIIGGNPYKLTEGEDILIRKVDHMNPFWHLWSPDSRKIAWLSSKRARGSASNIGVVSLSNRKINWIGPSDNAETEPVWSPNSEKIAFTRLSWDIKKRELLVSDAFGDDIQTIWIDVDKKGVSRDICGTSWSPDSCRIAFVSNRSGWNHLYVYSLDDDEPKQLTSGKYDIIYSDTPIQWSPDGSKIAFISNRNSLQESSVWIIPFEGGEAKRLVEMEGICTKFNWSPDGKYISFIHSGPSQMPSLWIKEVSDESDLILLYNPLVKDMDERDLAAIKPVKYEGSYGNIVHAILLTSKKIKKTEQHPAIVYMYGCHGQHARLGWPRIYPFMFLNYLVQNGYVVLIVDPPGSWGYGKDYEIAPNMDIGGKQVEDVALGAIYLSQLEYVNPDKIGVTGRSCGGYMAVQGLVRFPNLYSAGFSEVGSFDWKDYYEYTLRLPGEISIPSRCGMYEQNPDYYFDLNPINHVDKIKAPLLMLAGTEDINVPFHVAERMITALVKAGKDFEFMMYPGEPHRWTRIETWRDALKRVERFWDKHLK